MMLLFLKMAVASAMLAIADGVKSRRVFPSVDFELDHLSEVSRLNKNKSRPAETISSTKPITYMVHLDDEPLVVRHARRATTNEKYNRNSLHVADHERYLRSKRDDALDGFENVQVVYVFKHAFHGVAVRLTPEQAEELKSRPGVVSVSEDIMYKALTNQTPEFVGLTREGEAWSNGFTGENIVIGVVDGGINPDHPSFKDEATPQFGNTGDFIPFPSPRASFVGKGCAFVSEVEGDPPFSCNNKLIAARCYAAAFSYNTGDTFRCGGDGAFLPVEEFLSTRDVDGHGTHVASIAGGNYGVDTGTGTTTISGVAPRAQLVAYKVLWGGFGSGSDIMAGIDEAVADGVDVLNLSLGGSVHDSLIATSLLSALRAGVVTAAAAGNEGPDLETIGFPAAVPWVTAVAAGVDNPPSVEIAVDSVAWFSSRGPNPFTYDIIKPDVTAPGVDILGGDAADGVPGADFQSISGTSMASPHVAGMFALMKQAHPDWSPSAIKSAIMTTARQDYLDSNSNPATPFDIGSGFTQVNSAFNPGIVYDTSADDFEASLCGIDPSEVPGGGLVRCIKLSAQGFSFDMKDLNYPSIAYNQIGLDDPHTVTRTVTNVADETLTITATLTASEFSVSVTPCEVTLAPGQSASFEVEVKFERLIHTPPLFAEWSFGSLVWSVDKSKRGKKGKDGKGTCRTGRGIDGKDGKKGGSGKKKGTRGESGATESNRRGSVDLVEDDEGRDHVRRARTVAQGSEGNSKGGKDKGNVFKFLKQTAYSPIAVSFLPPFPLLAFGTGDDLSIDILTEFTEAEYSVGDVYGFEPDAKHEGTFGSGGQYELDQRFDIHTTAGLLMVEANLFDAFTLHVGDDLDMGLYKCPTSFVDCVEVDSTSLLLSTERVFYRPEEPLAEEAVFVVIVFKWSTPSTEYTLFTSEVYVNTPAAAQIKVDQSFDSTTVTVTLNPTPLADAFYHGLIFHKFDDKVVGDTVVTLAT